MIPKRIFAIALIMVSVVQSDAALAQCPEPSTLEFLQAEIRGDSIASYPPGTVFRSQTTTRRLDLRPYSGAFYYIIRRDVGAMPNRYTIGMLRDRAYRLAGWRCDNATAWLQGLPPLRLRNAADVWRAVFGLASVFNPVGESTHVFAPSGLVGLRPIQTVTRLTVDGVKAPAVARDSQGAWHGEATIFWSNIGYHGLKAVNWTFVFDDQGRLAFLREDGLAPRSNDSVRVFIGRDP
jgi:hypothetical protein